MLGKSEDAFGIVKFKTCLERMNKRGFPANQKNVSSNIIIVSTIVEYLPFMDWSDGGTLLSNNL